MPHDEYEVDDYIELRRIALDLIELRMRTGFSNDRILNDLRPMLDEDIDEF